MSMVEIESFDDRASAEVLAASLRAGGLNPRLSETGPLGGMGMPGRVLVLVPGDEADVARELLEDGRRTAQKLEVGRRAQWPNVPPEDLEAVVEAIRRKLRVNTALQYRDTSGPDVFACGDGPGG